MQNEPVKPKTKGKKNDPASIARRIVEAAQAIQEDGEQQQQSLRLHAAREAKKLDAVMAILQTRIDIRGQVQRLWRYLSSADQDTLREFGFKAPREER